MPKVKWDYCPSITKLHTSPFSHQMPATNSKYAETTEAGKPQATFRQGIDFLMRTIATPKGKKNTLKRLMGVENSQAPTETQVTNLLRVSCNATRSTHWSLNPRSGCLIFLLLKLSPQPQIKAVRLASPQLFITLTISLSIASNRQFCFPS